MQTGYPGLTVEARTLAPGCSLQLFDGLFAAGGITLSQVSYLTGLEPYLIQNWVKRGFVTSPVRRMYSRSQFARIVIINMLRDSLQLDVISSLIRVIGGEPSNPSDDLIDDEELYHRYVDLVASGNIDLDSPAALARAADLAASDFDERVPGARKQLSCILQVMLLAHAATHFRRRASEMLAELS